MDVLGNYEMQGFAPIRRDSFDNTQERPFLSAKGPKTIFAHARPSGSLRHTQQGVR